MNDFEKMLECRSLASEVIACMKGVADCGSRIARQYTERAEKSIKENPDIKEFVAREKGYIDGLEKLATQSETIYEFLRKYEERLGEMYDG